MFWKEGIHFSGDNPGGVRVSLCDECLSPRETSRSVPKYSLMNHLFRGQLPERVKDGMIQKRILAA